MWFVSLLNRKNLNLYYNLFLFTKFFINFFFKLFNLIHSLFLKVHKFLPKTIFKIKSNLPRMLLKYSFGKIYHGDFYIKITHQTYFIRIFNLPEYVTCNPTCNYIIERFSPSGRPLARFSPTKLDFHPQ